MTFKKKNIPRRILLLLAFAVFLFFPMAFSGWAERPSPKPDTWGRKILSDHLENWYQLDGQVYRSEQPDRHGMRELAAFGIKRVLNLRWLHDDEDEAEGTGLQLYHVPMRAESISENQIVEALKIIAASSDPILVHCRHGSDRTGAVSAMYRIVFQGWSKDAAIDEMRRGGYGFHAIFDNIPRFIEQVDVDLLRHRLAGGIPAAKLRPFTTDGCSAFPDGTLANPYKWRRCCIEHDRAYWKGGTYEERLSADRKLRSCVAESGEPELAGLMLHGVRIGGSPYFPTRFRWGYGWPRFRGYQPLSADEKAMTDLLEKNDRTWAQFFGFLFPA